MEFSLPQRVTLLEGFIKLLGAIREQAVADEALAEWEDYWFNEPKMKAVLMLLKESGYSRKISGESGELGVVYSDG